MIVLFPAGAKNSNGCFNNDIATLRTKLPQSVQDSAKQKLASLASSGETVLRYQQSGFENQTSRQTCR